MICSQKTRITGIFAAILVAALFAVFQIANSVNFPVTDDYYNLFVIAEKTLVEGWGVLAPGNLTEQIYSHRPVLIRATGALQVLLTGQIDLVGLRVLGVALHVAAFAIICVGLYRGHAWSPWWIALLAVLYFQPQLSGNFSMGMQGPQQFLSLGIAAALFLRSGATGARRWLLAWCCAFVAVLAMVNALLAAPLLLLWDLWQRRWRWALGSLLFCIFFVTFYFWDYQNASHAGTKEFIAADVIPGALVMLGGVFTFGPVPMAWTLVAGTGLLLVSIWCAWSALRRGELFVTAMILFLLGSVGMAAVGRAGWGLSYMLQWRYTSLSLLLVLLVAGYLVPRFAAGRGRLIAAAVVMCLFSALAWWQFGPRVVNEGRSIGACAMSWQLGTPAFFADDDRHVTLWTEQLSRAIRDGVYELPFREKAEGLLRDCRRPLDSNEVPLRYETAVAGYCAVMGGGTSHSEFIVFREDETRPLVAARSDARFAIGRFVRGLPQTTDVTYLLPRTSEAREVPAGTWLVP